MEKRKAVGYLDNVIIKPLSIDTLGNVMFTSDGITKIKPNENQCLAYGYNYDKATGTCRAYNFKPNYETQVTNIGNKITGIDSDIRRGTQHSQIVGDFNTVLGTSRNTIILGDKNTVNQYVDNSIAIGVSAEVTTSNSIVLGGNNPTDILGERQSIQLMYGKQTTDGSTKASNLNNTGGSYFEIPINTAIYFHADILAVRVGGTDTSGGGLAGDFGSWTERGVAINKNGVLSISRERDTVQHSGHTTNWRPTAVVSGTNFGVNVRGHADTTIEWCCNIRLTQMKTSVTL